MDHSQILQSLRGTGAYSDLTVICGDKTFKLHKCILCLRSNWFAAACQEGRWKEGKEGVIGLQSIEDYGEGEDFSCDEPEAVSYMIDFMYLGDYDLGPAAAAPDPKAPSLTSHAPRPTFSFDPETFEPMYEDAPPEDFILSPSARKKHKKARWTIASSDQNIEPLPLIGTFTGIAQTKGSLTMHTRLYALGTKYGMKSLKEASIEKMKQAVRGTWDREDFAKAIAVAFGATPDDDRGMREVVIQTVLSCSGNLANDPIIEKAINAVEGLPFELFKRQSTSSKRKGY